MQADDMPNFNFSHEQALEWTILSFSIVSLMQNKRLKRLIAQTSRTSSKLQHKK
jgi:hypothetical protein